MATNLTETQNNIVKLRGTVMNVYSKGKMTIIRIATSAHSRISDYPSIVFYGNKAVEVAENYKRLDKVTIVGRAATSKKIINDAPVFRQFIQGLDISTTPTYLESVFGQESATSGYLPDENFVQLSGEVVHIYNPSSTNCILTIKIISGEYLNFPKVTFFRNNAKKAQEISIGDKIFVTGSVQTNYVDNPDGSRKYFESLVATNSTIIE